MISLSWLIIGLTIALFAVILDPKRGGFLGALLVGTVGSILGGFTASLLVNSGTAENIITPGLVIAFAIVLITISRSIRRI